VKPSKFCGSLFYGSIFKMSRANFKYLWLGFSIHYPKPEIAQVGRIL
jgi:hypothetical protein